MKHIKSGKTVTCKIQVPKGAEWKLLSLMLQDLELSSEDSALFLKAIRSRDLKLLSKAIHDFQPRSIIGTFGTVDKRKAHDFYKKYQLSCFLKKYPFKGVDTKGVAISKFKAAEKICGAYNRENHRALLRLSDSHPDYLGVIEELRKDVSDCLGKLPSFACISDHAMHGPGVSIGDQYKSGASTTYFKFSRLPYTVTQPTLALARFAIESDQRWIGALNNWYREKNSIPIHFPINLEDFWASVFNVVDGNRITTVPKSFDTDRTIAIEPLMNVYLQLGVDRILRQRIRRNWGYNLNSQELNQQLAEEGSLDNSLVTLDLRGASDTISLKIAEILLPVEWFDLLMDLRSPVGDLDGEAVHYEKLSSMGNGFTFAIETLIFGAIARCAIRRTRSVKRSAVYGDDIIVPRTASKLCISLLNLCGFEINDDKSFDDGPFRESCGKDYFLGVLVRPLFLKRVPNRLPTLFYLFNSLTVLERSLPWHWGVEFPLTKAKILSWIPKVIQQQFYGPVSDSLDTHLFLDRPLLKRQIGGRDYKYYFKISPRPKIYNSNTDFFFRKLMNTLKGDGSANVDRWDLERIAFDSGNAFNVVKRGRVQMFCTRCTLP